MLRMKGDQSTVVERTRATGQMIGVGVEVIVLVQTSDNTPRDEARPFPVMNFEGPFPLPAAISSIARPDATELVSPGVLSVTFPGLPEGSYDLTVSNGAGCDDTLLAAFVVYPRPIVFFVDPPVIYNGVDVQATLWVANVNGGDVNKVEMRPVGTTTLVSITTDCT